MSQTESILNSLHQLHGRHIDEEVFELLVALQEHYNDPDPVVFCDDRWSNEHFSQLFNLMREISTEQGNMVSLIRRLLSLKAQVSDDIDYI